MFNKNNPKLCFGTFFVLLLRECVDNISVKKWGMKSDNDITEVTAFLELNRIIAPSYKSNNMRTLATQTSKFKSCDAKNAKNLPIVNASETKSFINQFEEEYEIVYRRMLIFTNRYICQDKSRWERLVKSLLELIREDNTIKLEEKFFVNGIKSLTKAELLEEREISFVAFLLGVFRYVIENRRESNKEGKETYERWCPPANQGIRNYSEAVYIGDSINGEIRWKEEVVKSLPLPELITEKKEYRELGDLRGIDKADYLANEAKLYKSNEEYEKALQLYYEAWILYREEVGSKGRSALKIYDIMKDIFEKLDYQYSFIYWLENKVTEE